MQLIDARDLIKNTYRTKEILNRFQTGRVKLQKPIGFCNWHENKKQTRPDYDDFGCRTLSTTGESFELRHLPHDKHDCDQFPCPQHPNAIKQF